MKIKKKLIEIEITSCLAKLYDQFVRLSERRRKN